MEMGTIRTKVSRSHSEIIAFLSLTFCNPNPTYDTETEACQNPRQQGQKQVSMSMEMSNH